MGAGFVFRAYQRDQGTIENKGAAGGTVYWSGYLHGTIFLLFSLFFLAGVKYAWFFLTADIFLGLVTVLNHYFNSVPLE